MRLRLKIIFVNLSLSLSVYVLICYLHIISIISVTYILKVNVVEAFIYYLIKILNRFFIFNKK